MTIFLIRKCLGALLLLLASSQLAGCFLIDENINNTPRIRQAGYIGKRFTTLAPMPLLSTGFFNELRTPDYPAFENDHVIDRLPAGTHLRITKAEYINFAGVADKVRTTAVLESGPHKGTTVFIEQLVDGWRLTASRNVFYPDRDKTSITGDPEFPWIVWLLPYRDQPFPWASQLSPTGQLTNPAVDTLLLSLHDPDWVVRYHAARTLRDATSRREQAAAALVAALDDTDADVIRRILASLIKLQPTTPATLNTIVEILTQHQFKNRPYLGQDDLPVTLSHLGKPAALAIAAALPTLDQDLLKRLLNTLQKIGPEAGVALPAIITRARLEVGDPRMFDGSDSLGESLEVIDPATAVQLSLPLLHDPDPKVRALFARTCGGAWNHNNAAIPDLLNLLHDPSVEVRQIATNSLCYTKPSPAELESMITPVIQATHDPDPTVQANSIKFLGNPGPRWPAAAGQQAVIALQASLKDPDPTVRSTAVFSLSRLKATFSQKPPYARAAFKAMIPALSDSDTHVRATAARYLAEYETSADPALNESLPYLLTALKDLEPTVRLAALQSLDSTALNRFAQSEIKSLLQDSSPEVRAQAQKLIIPEKPQPTP